MRGNSFAVLKQKRSRAYHTTSIFATQPPEVTRWLGEKPAKNALEALLLMVQAIYALLQPPELPVPHKEMVELAQTLAQGYDFAIAWPYTRAQMEAAMSPGHPDLRPNIPDEHILFVAGR